MANFRRRFMPHVIAFTNRVVWKLDIGHGSAKKELSFIKCARLVPIFPKLVADFPTSLAVLDRGFFCQSAEAR